MSAPINTQNSRALATLRAFSGRWNGTTRFISPLNTNDATAAAAAAAAGTAGLRGIGERVWYLKLTPSPDGSGVAYRLNTTTGDSVVRTSGIQFHLPNVSAMSDSAAGSVTDVLVGGAPQDEALSHTHITAQPLLPHPYTCKGGDAAATPVVITVSEGGRVRQVHTFTPITSINDAGAGASCGEAAAYSHAGGHGKAAADAGHAHEHAHAGYAGVSVNVSYYDRCGVLLMTEAGVLQYCDPRSAVKYPVTTYDDWGEVPTSADDNKHGHRDRSDREQGAFASPDVKGRPSALAVEVFEEINNANKDGAAQGK